MDKEEYAAFLDLLMCSDPWPCGMENEKTLKDLADRKAKEMGYTDWIDAYHQIQH